MRLEGLYGYLNNYVTVDWKDKLYVLMVVCRMNVMGSYDLYISSAVSCR